MHRRYGTLIKLRRVATPHFPDFLSLVSTSYPMGVLSYVILILCVYCEYLIGILSYLLRILSYVYLISILSYEYCILSYHYHISILSHEYLFL